MVKIIDLTKIIFFIIGLTFLLYWPKGGYSQEDKISYLPSTIQMDTIDKDYAYLTLSGVIAANCTGANELFNQSENCYTCVNERLNICPDCCLVNTDPTWPIQCTSAADPRYSCAESASFIRAFDPVSCPSTGYPIPFVWSDECSAPATPPLLQHNGCPSLGPPLPTPSEYTCSAAGPNAWKCSFNRPHAEPTTPGCVANADSTTSPCPGPYYVLTPVPNFSYPPDYPCPPCQLIDDPEHSCPDGCILSTCTPAPVSIPPVEWIYQPKAAFQACKQTCDDYTNNWDNCNNDFTCCKTEVCPALDTTNTKDNHLDTYCRDADESFKTCLERIDPENTAKKCTPAASDYHNITDCHRLRKEAQDCLLYGRAGCSNCFQPIDLSFEYKFVAQSQQTLNITWEITPYYAGVINPNILPLANKFFYTKVRVYKLATSSSSETLVHESMVHSKAFDSGFSVYCSTHVPLNTLETGQSYSIRLYYYFVGDALQIQIQNNRLIIIRSRE